MRLKMEKKKKKKHQPHLNENGIYIIIWIYESELARIEAAW